jgi:hypothetical protein
MKLIRAGEVSIENNKADRSDPLPGDFHIGHVNDV